MAEKQKTQGEVKGLRIQTLNYIMILVACVLYAFVLYETILLTVRYKELEKSTQDYINSEKAATDLNDGSDVLTEQVRLFAVTGRLDYAEAYFEEANETKNREKALEALEQFHPDDSVYSYLKEALNYSYDLMDREIYSMRLVAEAKHYSMDELPKEIRQVNLKEEDVSLSSDELMKKAQNIVFDTAYRDAKALIVENIHYSINTILGQIRDTQVENEKKMQNTIMKQGILISILFVMNVVIFFFITVLIVKPLQIYVKCINDNKTLEVLGSYEFKYLALTYNNIYELNAANEVMLRKKAEQDGLTGVLNRAAFDQIQTGLAAHIGPFALLLIDVDQFKQVNDSLGHEMGDGALKKVANVLETSFRTMDYVARIGGDEFAVIMMEVDKKMKDLIQQKVRAMNQSLQAAEDGLPALSISVGVSFSNRGYHDRLFQEADKALYQVKRTGRGGCVFYDETENETA